MSQPGFEVDILGTHASGDSPYYLQTVISGEFAFVSNRIFNVGAEIEVLDISDPTQPVLKDVLPTSGFEISSMVIRDDFLYVSLLNGVEVYDINDPVNGQSVGFLPSSGSSYMLEIIKDHLYIADYSGGVQIASLENDPATPVIVGSYPAADQTKWIWAADPLLYVRSGGEVTVLDISDPTSPFPMGSFDDDFFYGPVLMLDSLAYVGKFNSVDVVDLTNPTGPVIAATVPTAQVMGPMAIDQDKL